MSFLYQEMLNRRLEHVVAITKIKSNTEMANNYCLGDMAEGARMSEENRKSKLLY